MALQFQNGQHLRDSDAVWSLRLIDWAVQSGLLSTPSHDDAPCGLTKAILPRYGAVFVKPYRTTYHRTAHHRTVGSYRPVKEAQNDRMKCHLHVTHHTFRDFCAAVAANVEVEGHGVFGNTPHTLQICLVCNLKQVGIISRFGTTRLLKALKGLLSSKGNCERSPRVEVQTCRLTIRETLRVCMGIKFTSRLPRCPPCFIPISRPLIFSKSAGGTRRN